jgi:Leucine-rich repeat (LRR) protein
VFAGGVIRLLTHLKTLMIGGFCEELDASLVSVPLPSNTCTPPRKAMTEWGWAKLNSLPDKIQRITALRSLYINGFDGIQALPEWLGNLSSLQRLYLSKCKNLMHLPTAQAM